MRIVDLGSGGMAAVSMISTTAVALWHWLIWKHGHWLQILTDKQILFLTGSGVS